MRFYWAGLITLFLFISSPAAHAQPQPLDALPAYDCALTKVMALIGKPMLLVAPDDARGLDPILNDYCATLRPNCTRKSEVALTPADYGKHLFIVGELAKFRHWEKFGVPVQQLPAGFSVNNRSFGEASAGFAFVDTTHIIVSGNSLQGLKDAQLALTGGHDLLITEGGKITYFGNYQAGRFSWYNLQDLKAANYTRHQSGSCAGIYVSNTFKELVDFPKVEKDLQTYAQQFRTIYHLPKLAAKPTWFLHTNLREYGTMSGMFGLTCPGNSSAGFSIRGEIHTNGFNATLVKHEYAHFLFDKVIPQATNCAFFIEGCVEYVTNRNDPALYQQRLTLARQQRDALPYEDLIVRNKDFYGSQSEANYAACGVFVKYLLDTHGVEPFKQYCLASDRAVATKALYRVDFPALVAGYAAWLARQ